MLEERLRLMRIEKYGAGGEKLSQAQMLLFELEPVVSEMTEPAESEPAPRSVQPRNLSSIRAARSCRRIFRASSGFCLAHVDVTSDKSGHGPPHSGNVSAFSAGSIARRVSNRALASWALHK